MNVKAGHFLEGTDYTQFDASFFNMSPNEAKVRLRSSVELEQRLTHAGNGSKSPDAYGRSLRSSRER